MLMDDMEFKEFREFKDVRVCSLSQTLTSLNYFIALNNKTF